MIDGHFRTDLELYKTKKCKYELIVGNNGRRLDYNLTNLQMSVWTITTQKSDWRKYLPNFTFGNSIKYVMLWWKNGGSHGYQELERGVC